jgi:hypothetical protein
MSDWLMKYEPEEKIQPTTVCKSTQGQICVSAPLCFVYPYGKSA